VLVAGVLPKFECMIIATQGLVPAEAIALEFLDLESLQRKCDVNYSGVQKGFRDCIVL